MSDFLNNFFEKNKILFFIFNLAFIILLLKIFQVLAYPETNFEEALNYGNISFMLFGLEDEMGGLSLTFLIALIVIILSFALGSLLGIARYSDIVIIKIPAILYIELFRALPLIMIIFWIFFALPVMSLVLFETAYIAKIVRAGLHSMPKGQFEAAKVIGMNTFQVFILIILQQVYRRMIPAILSQFISLFKDTSLVYIIGVIELFRAATIVNNRIYMSFEILSFVAITYFICSFSLSKIAQKLEQDTSKQINS